MSESTVSKRKGTETTVVFLDVCCNPAAVLILSYSPLIHTFATGYLFDLIKLWGFVSLEIKVQCALSLWMLIIGAISRAKLSDFPLGAVCVCAQW